MTRGYRRTAADELGPVAIPPGAPRRYEFTVNATPRPKPKVTDAQVEGHRVALKTHGFGDPTLQRYFGFCSDVRASFLDRYQSIPWIASNMFNLKKPFCIDDRFKGMAVIIEGWIRHPKSPTGICKHGDPDNILGSVMDALFAGPTRTADCHVCPRVMGLECDSENPGMDLILTFP